MSKIKLNKWVNNGQIFTWKLLQIYYLFIYRVLTYDIHFWWLHSLLLDQNTNQFH